MSGRATLAWQREARMGQEGAGSERLGIQTLTLFIAQIDEMSPVTLTKGLAGAGPGGGGRPAPGRTRPLWVMFSLNIKHVKQPPTLSQ